MSSLFPQENDGGFPGQSDTPTGGLNFNAPLFTPRHLTAPVIQNISGAADSTLDDTEVGRASQMLDSVRNRMTSWQDAKKWLDALKPSDKRILIATRQGNLNEDEQRALGLKGGDGGGFFHDVNKVFKTAVDYTPLGLAVRGDKWLLGQVHNPVTDVAGNAVGDIGNLVKDTPAGLVKSGMAVAGDLKTTLTTNPLESSSILASLTGHEAHPSATQQEVINPTLHNYAQTYGPLFRGDVGTTASRMADHPLGPVLDALALASMGLGTAGRLGLTARSVAEESGVRNVLKATTPVAENGGAEAGGLDRLGRVDRTNETYQPLGYNKEFYVRPTTQQIKNQPWMNHFSVLIDPENGNALFSPVGSSHDEIYDPLVEGHGTAKKSYWDNNNHIQATGIFDPRTGKVATININSEDVIGPYIGKIPELISKVKAEADQVYVTKSQLKLDKNAAEKGTITIQQNSGKRFDPTTGQELPPTYYVTRVGTGERIGANFPDKNSALGYAQSLITGGVGVRQLAKEWMPYVTHEAETAPGTVRLYRGSGNQPVTGVPDWMAANQGRWFTSDASTATRYATERGGQVSYVDVPEDVARQLKVEGGSGADEYLLPQQFVDQAKPLEATTKRMRITTGEEIQGAKFSPTSPRSGFFTPETKVQPFQAKSRAELALDAFTQRPRGSLLDAFENARGRSHADEWGQIMSEVIGNVLDNPDAKTRAGMASRIQEAIKQMGEDLSTSGQRDLSTYLARHNADTFLSPTAALGVSALGVSVRELSDMIRAGAVFLRPAYIPNNWAGNGFLTTIHQGVYAPVNLAKSLFMDKHLGVEYTRAIDQSTGFNAANIQASERGTGYMAALTDPIAKLMGKIADQPFRRAAWLHEARRAGYTTLGQVRQFLDAVAQEAERFGNPTENLAEGETVASRLERMPATRKMGEISRNAQEEIIKFGKYNDVERGVLKNLIFVYSWMRGAARYFGRFPLQHPIQAAAYMNAANIGQNWLNQELGGVPNFLIGAIPVGKDKDGNSILVNPFSVNPLGTGQQMVAAASSIKDIIQDPSSFNRYSQQDPVQLLNPLIGMAMEAYQGGRPPVQGFEKSIAGLRLIQNLEHPGRGQIYPMTRREALGQYFIGSMYPRKSSEAGIERALQRERADQPEQRIDDELKIVHDNMHVDLPPEFVDMYRQDLAKLKQQKDFQHSYAQDHGSQGFANMPPSNRAEAALDYLTKFHLIDPQTIQVFRDQIAQTTNNLQMNDLANSLWRITGAGGVKSRWDEIVTTARMSSELTPVRP